MNAIVEKIQLLKLPFMMDTPTKGAGNCFFEAILQQCEHRPELQWVGSFVSAKVIRQEICTFVRTASFPHIDDYRKNHDEVEQIKWDSFFTRMGRQRVWASGPVVQVAAWYLERDIL